MNDQFCLLNEKIWNKVVMASIFMKEFQNLTAEEKYSRILFAKQVVELYNLEILLTLTNQEDLFENK